MKKLVILPALLLALNAFACECDDEICICEQAGVVAEDNEELDLASECVEEDELDEVGTL